MGRKDKIYFKDHSERNEEIIERDPGEVGCQHEGGSETNQRGDWQAWEENGNDNQSIVSRNDGPIEIINLGNKK